MARERVRRAVLWSSVGSLISFGFGPSYMQHQHGCPTSHKCRMTTKSPNIFMGVLVASVRLHATIWVVSRQGARPSCGTGNHVSLRRAQTINLSVDKVVASYRGRKLYRVSPRLSQEAETLRVDWLLGAMCHLRCCRSCQPRPFDDCSRQPAKIGPGDLYGTQTASLRPTLGSLMMNHKIICYGRNYSRHLHDPNPRRGDQVARADYMLHLLIIVAILSSLFLSPPPPCSPGLWVDATSYIIIIYLNETTHQLEQVKSHQLP